MGESFGLPLKSDDAVTIRYEDWLRGFSIFKIDFSRFPDHGVVAGSYLNQRKACSSLDAHISFKEGIKTDIQMLFYTSFPELIQIGRSESALRDVKLNFSL